MSDLLLRIRSGAMALLVSPPPPPPPPPPVWLHHALFPASVSWSTSPTPLGAMLWYLSGAASDNVPLFAQHYPILCSAAFIISTIATASLLEQAGLPVRPLSARLMKGKRVSTLMFGAAGGLVLGQSLHSRQSCMGQALLELLLSCILLVCPGAIIFPRVRWRSALLALNAAACCGAFWAIWMDAALPSAAALAALAGLLSLRGVEWLTGMEFMVPVASMVSQACQRLLVCALAIVRSMLSTAARVWMAILRNLIVPAAKLASSRVIVPLAQSMHRHLLIPLSKVACVIWREALQPALLLVKLLAQLSAEHAYETLRRVWRVVTAPPPPWVFRTLTRLYSSVQYARSRAAQQVDSVRRLLDAVKSVVIVNVLEPFARAVWLAMRFIYLHCLSPLLRTANEFLSAIVPFVWPAVLYAISNILMLEGTRLPSNATALWFADFTRSGASLTTLWASFILFGRAMRSCPNIRIARAGYLIQTVSAMAYLRCDLFVIDISIAVGRVLVRAARAVGRRIEGPLTMGVRAMLRGLDALITALSDATTAVAQLLARGVRVAISMVAMVWSNPLIALVASGATLFGAHALWSGLIDVSPLIDVMATLASSTRECSSSVLASAWQSAARVGRTAAAAGGLISSASYSTARDTVTALQRLYSVSGAAYHTPGYMATIYMVTLMCARLSLLEQRISRGDWEGLLSTVSVLAGGSTKVLFIPIISLQMVSHHGAQAVVVLTEVVALPVAVCYIAWTARIVRSEIRSQRSDRFFTQLELSRGDCVDGASASPEAIERALDALPRPTRIFAECSECAICLEPLAGGGRVQALPCGHAFHRAPCLHQLVAVAPRQVRCPLCRTGMEDYGARYIGTLFY